MGVLTCQARLTPRNAPISMVYVRNCCILLTMAMAAIVAAGQTAPAVPRAADGKPDLSGFWDIPYVPNMSMGKEAEVPYTALGQAAYKNHDSKDDPTGVCLPPGVPRIMQSPF